MNYPKEYTVKEWKKFNQEIDGSNIGNQYQFFNFFTQRMESFESVTAQEILLQKYDIILTDHRTKKEKLKSVFSPKNLNKNIDKFQNGITKFTKVLDQLDGSKMKLFEGVSKKEYESLLGKPEKRNYNILGSKRDFTALTGSKPKKKRKGKRSKPKPERDYSFITGNKKTKMFNSKRMKF